MALVLVGGRHGARKPVGPWWELDRAHPMARGLAVYIPFLEGGGDPVNLVDRVSCARRSGAAWEQLSRGLALADGGAGQFSVSGYQPFTSSDGAGTGDGTVAILANTPATAAVTFLTEATSGTPLFGIRANTFGGVATSGGIQIITRDAVGLTAAEVNAGHVDGTYKMFVGTRVGTTLRLYVDGVEVATATGTVRDFLSGTMLLEAGVGGVTPSYNADPGDPVVIAYANRGWSADEVRAFTDAPFDLLRPMRRRVFFALGGGTTFNQGAAASASGLTSIGRGAAKVLAAQANVTAAAWRQIAKIVAIAAGLVAGLIAALGGQSTRPARATARDAPVVRAEALDAAATAATAATAAVTGAAAGDTAAA